MSGGALVVEQPVATLVIEIPNADASVALVATQQSASLVAVTEQGPGGRNGTDAQLGFGYVRYGESPTGPLHTLDAGVRVPFMLTPDPSQARRTLRFPFDTHEFWDGTILRTRGLDDVIEMRMVMTAVTTVSGGHLDMEVVQAGAGAGVSVSTRRALLSDQAGSQEKIDFVFILFTGPAFTANGAQLFMTASVPLQIKNEVIAIVPITLGALP